VVSTKRRTAGSKIDLKVILIFQDPVPQGARVASESPPPERVASGSLSEGGIGYAKIQDLAKKDEPQRPQRPRRMNILKILSSRSLWSSWFVFFCSSRSFWSKAAGTAELFRVSPPEAVDYLDGFKNSILRVKRCVVVCGIWY
jgi:hypothetical protein